jgi:hypothetical protein
MLFFLTKNPGRVQVLKRRNTEFFQLWNYFLNKFFARQTTNTGYCAIRGLGPSDKIDQAQSQTKLHNFGWDATRTKRFKAPGIGIHKLDHYMLPLPRGPSKRYINLIIWSRPRFLTELKDVKHLTLESTGIFAGKSQELDFTLSSLNTL